MPRQVDRRVKDDVPRPNARPDFFPESASPGGGNGRMERCMIVETGACPCDAPPGVAGEFTGVDAGRWVGSFRSGGSWCQSTSQITKVIMTHLAMSRRPATSSLNVRPLDTTVPEASPLSLAQVGLCHSAVHSTQPTPAPSPAQL
jgi:hypothetical protein